MYKFNILDQTINLNQDIMSSLYNEDYGRKIDHVFKWLIDYNFDYKGSIFDVGSNVGLYSLAYQVIFPKSKVFSFEASDKLFQLLNSNINSNKPIGDKIETVNLAISNQKGLLEFGYPTPEQHPRYDNEKNIINPGLISAQSIGKKSFVVDSISLDEFVLEKNIDKVDFIKIDVEGHEYQVLTGAIETIKEFSPVIIFEYNEITQNLSNFTLDSYLEFIYQIKYDVYGLKYGWASKLEKLDLSSRNIKKELKAFSDLVIFPSNN